MKTQMTTLLLTLISAIAVLSAPTVELESRQIGDASTFTVYGFRASCSPENCEYGFTLSHEGVNTYCEASDAVVTPGRFTTVSLMSCDDNNALAWSFEELDNGVLQLGVRATENGGAFASTGTYYIPTSQYEIAVVNPGVAVTYFGPPVFNVNASVDPNTQ
ncbi:hypothetical protein BX600DRAFT_516782 [Xylariales sp. PMI_506]|nr:hypothetical protein BX600DRAFT_516782 [Xylariales sp. PMI_506]